jgi:hypothetical protein
MGLPSISTFRTGGSIGECSVIAIGVVILDDYDCALIDPVDGAANLRHGSRHGEWGLTVR